LNNLWIEEIYEEEYNETFLLAFENNYKTIKECEKVKDY